MPKIPELANPKAGDMIPLDTPSREKDENNPGRLIEKRATIHQMTHVRSGVVAEIARLESLLAEQNAILAEMDAQGVE